MQDLAVQALEQVSWVEEQSDYLAWRRAKAAVSGADTDSPGEYSR